MGFAHFLKASFWGLLRLITENLNFREINFSRLNILDLSLQIHFMTAERAVTDQFLWGLVLGLTDKQYQAETAWQVNLKYYSSWF